MEKMRRYISGVSLFEVKLRVEKTDETGCRRKVTECYLVEAFSFGEAEKTALDEIGGYVDMDIVLSVSKVKYSELWLRECSHCGRYFKVVVEVLTVDERTEKEKRTRLPFLVESVSLDDCRDVVKEMLRDAPVSWDVVQMKEVGYVDVIV